VGSSAGHEGLIEGLLVDPQLGLPVESILDLTDGVGGGAYR